MTQFYQTSKFHFYFSSPSNIWTFWNSDILILLLALVVWNFQTLCGKKNCIKNRKKSPFFQFHDFVFLMKRKSCMQSFIILGQGDLETNLGSRFITIFLNKKSTFASVCNPTRDVVGEFDSVLSNFRLTTPVASDAPRQFKIVLWQIKSTRRTSSSLEKLNTSKETSRLWKIRKPL